MTKLQIAAANQVPRTIECSMHPATPAATLTEADILAALRDCYDPNLTLNIVELGLVHSISVAPDPGAPGAGIPGVPPRHRVHIALIPARDAVADSDADADADAKDTSLAALVRNRLAGFETISRTDVSLLREPRWTPDRIRPEARARLTDRLTSTQPPHALVQIQTRPAKS